MSDAVLGLPAMVRWLELFQTKIAAAREWLTELDSAIGDADHGANMDRGMNAVVAKLSGGPAASFAELFKNVGMTLVSSVGGASGPLYGTFFMRFGMEAGAVAQVDAAGLGGALRAGLGGIVARGKAEVGDKTMVDAMTPALDAYDAALAVGQAPPGAVQAALAAAVAGRDATIPLVARKGRASYLGERSAGHMDPGSASTVLLFEALAEAVESDSTE
ncbi:MAG: dihydroxyacetone kinase subunit L [Bifidobacteriaceae bacterium]|jgi:dihydroxyacetone kinase-like protein|nr:dihydroxyacetone kinase subunit L [Bifidobacteriaceae bacterium]